jgi:hypothetical protein
VKSEEFASAMIRYNREGGPLRSGTSISANVHESEFAQSPSDFASKLHSALKEANKTVKKNNQLNH